MAPTELGKLNDQLKDLFGKGFIRPSMSTLGAPFYICTQERCLIEN